MIKGANRTMRVRFISLPLFLQLSEFNHIPRRRKTPQQPMPRRAVRTIYSKLLANEMAVWGRVIRDAGVKIDQ
jgi:hypothetical protein